MTDRLLKDTPENTVLSNTIHDLLKSVLQVRSGNLSAAQFTYGDLVDLLRNFHSFAIDNERAFHIKKLEHRISQLELKVLAEKAGITEPTYTTERLIDQLRSQEVREQLGEGIPVTLEDKLDVAAEIKIINKFAAERIKTMPDDYARSYLRRMRQKEKRDKGGITKSE